MTICCILLNVWDAVFEFSLFEKKTKESNIFSQQHFSSLKQRQ